MINVSLLLVGYCLGVFSVCSVIGLFLLHRPRYTAPTLHRRRNRDKPLPVTPPVWEKEESPVEPLYMYGVTGLEE